MRQKLTRSVRVLIAALVLWLPSAMHGQTAPPGDVIQIRVPPTIASLTMVKRHDYEDPSDGVQLRYVGADSLPIDIFVYPGPDLEKECPLDCARQVMQDEIDGFQTAFPEMIQRHYVDSIAVVHQDTLAHAAGAPWALARHLTLAVVRNGVSQRSDYVLYLLPGYQVKIRATYAPSDRNTGLVMAFLDAAVPALTSTGESKQSP